LGNRPLKILIYTESVSNRLKYTLIVLFNQVLKVDFELTTDVAHFQASKLAKLSYSNNISTQTSLFIPKHHLLFDTKITPQPIEVNNTSNYLTFFTLLPQHQGFIFDVFAASFYLITRYEEYLPFTKDTHGRFEAKQSLSFQNGFLQLPIINIWMEDLRKQLNVEFNLSIPKPAFQFQPTYDIDFAWAYRQKNAFRTIGSLTKQLLKGQTQQIAVLLGQKEDPYDVYDYLDELHKKHALKPLYFWLLGDYAEFDKNHSPQNKAFRQLINHIAHRYDIGIHPSYRSNEHIDILRMEVARLRHISSKKILQSRQHFLKLSFPQTYTHLERLGIKADYSMGYADEIGFRAGIATPYLWYDLPNERITNLTIHPFEVMDVTLKQYLAKSPAQGVVATKQIIQSIYQSGGTFSLLWHNSSLSDVDGWTGWREAFEEIITFASQLTKQQNDI